METCLTIYVTFDGLGFCCFNTKRKGAEIAFLRLPGHNLEITVTGSDGRHKFIGKIADNAKIELVSQDTAITGIQLNNDGTFNRKNGLDGINDPSDLRWLLDCEGNELHKKEAKAKGNTGSVRDLTEMFLPNAYFYTEQVLSAQCDIERTDGTTNRPTSERFGLIGETLGARVDAVRASLQIDGNNVFQFDEGVDCKLITRFFVTISNTCETPPTEPPSDFHKYYEVLDFGNDEKFDFKPVKDKLLYPRPAMCEVVLLGKTKTLDPFFQK